MKPIGPLMREHRLIERMIALLNGELKRITEKYGRSLPQLALAWILSNETITSAICGVSSLKQLEQNLGTTELELSEEELAACNSAMDSSST